MLRKYFKVKKVNTSSVNNSTLDNLHAETEEFKKITANGFDDIGHELSYLYKILTPSKHKALLDMSIKLYDDEVSRYRFLEEKANKILGFIGLLLPIYLSFIIWLSKSQVVNFNYLTYFLIFSTAFYMMIIIFVLIQSFKFIRKPYMAITCDTLNIVDKEGFETLYLHFYKAFIEAVEKYINFNRQKSEKIAFAYDLITVMYVLSLLSLGSISYTYLTLIYTDS